MIACRMDNLLYFRFHGLNGYDGIRHAVFTRLGGYSPTPCDSLNMGENPADTMVNVQSNRRLAAACLGSRARLTVARQVHGLRIWSLKQADTGCRVSAKTPAPVADALITDIPGHMLAIQIADCQAVLLYDPVCSVIANVHSGWRGSVGNIAGLTVQQMQKEFGCNPADIRAGVSPSLGPCCGEFKNYLSELPEALWSYGNKQQFFNFWAITRDQLENAGLAPEHIELSRICTKCNAHLFFSYRAHRATGRFVAVIGLSAGAPIDGNP